MKSMTCNQLGGACNKVFQADTFEEIAALIKKHGTEMFHAKDAAHLKAMSKMKSLMKTPEDMQRWYMERKTEFEALPYD